MTQEDQMSTITAPEAEQTIATSAAQRILLTGIRWQTYEAILRDIGNRPIRLTYDRGALEIMAPTFNHERCKRQLGRIVETLAEELNLPLVSAGSTTFREVDLERGLEPDDCFYLGFTVPLVLGKTRIDLNVDPPPDLALEIDITASFLNRLNVYAALKVPEIWRFNGQRLQVFRLQPDGQHALVDRSATFPMIAISELEEFLQSSLGMDDSSLVRSFRVWLHDKGVGTA